MNNGFDDTSIPELSPCVEDTLMQCLANEVQLYSTTLRGMKCQLCPFRSFDRLSRLQNHMKYHCAKNIYMANVKSPQRMVIRAYFDYIVSTGPILSIDFEKMELLKWSADLIAGWNRDCSDDTMDILKNQNLPILVRVLTHTRPQY